jgi:GAF domain-containing protein
MPPADMPRTRHAKRGAQLGGGVFTEDDEYLIEILGKQAGVTLHNAKQYDRYSRLHCCICLVCASASETRVPRGTAPSRTTRG